VFWLSWQECVTACPTAADCDHGIDSALWQECVHRYCRHYCTALHAEAVVVHGSVHAGIRMQDPVCLCVLALLHACGPITFSECLS